MEDGFQGSDDARLGSHYAAGQTRQQGTINFGLVLLDVHAAMMQLGESASERYSWSLRQQKNLPRDPFRPCSTTKQHGRAAALGYYGVACWDRAGKAWRSLCSQSSLGEQELRRG